MDILQQAVADTAYDIRDYKICAANSFPENFLCEFPISIKNQGSKPTCVAHAVSSLIEYHYYKHSKKTRLFSTEFIYGIRELGYYKGDGMRIKNALNTALKYGDPFKTECPGNNDVEDAIKNIEAKEDEYKELAYPHRISAYYKCTSEEEIKTALLNHGPVAVSMNTYDGATIINDTYAWDATRDFGKHCVLVVGWNQDGWIIHNSWGKAYAGDGRFTLPYEFKLNEAWGVADDIDDECIKKPSKLLTFFASIINRIMNWILNFKK